MRKWWTLWRLLRRHRDDTAHETSDWRIDDIQTTVLAEGNGGNQQNSSHASFLPDAPLAALAKAYTLSTSFGTDVFIDPHGRASHGYRAEQARAYLIPLSDRKALLCQYSATQSDCQFIPLIIRYLEATDEVALYDCSSGRPLTAEPLEKEQPVLASDRRRVGTWETFRLAPVAVPAAIAAYESHPAVVPAAFGVFESPVAATENALALSLARLDLPAHPVDMVRQMQESDLHCKFRGFNDFWLAESTPGLKRWLENRPARQSSILVGPELDWLAGYEHSSNRPSFKAHMTLRGSVRPRYGACILATARNEGVYLLEWIAHHRKLGFEHFFLYSNDNEDGSDLLLECLAKAGIITWLRNELAAPVSPQVKAYGHALSILPDILDYEWCLIIDIDEFLGLDADRFLNVRRYLEWQQALEVDAIALNWVWFGTFGASNYQPGQLVTRRFYHRRPDVDKHIKSMIRPISFFHSHPHYPKSPSGQRVFRDAAGEIYEGQPEEFAFSSHPLETPAWIAHYWSKSLDEVLSKFNRGRGDMAMAGRLEPIRLLSDVAHRVLRPEQHVAPRCDRRLIELVPDLEQEIEHLRSYPGVRRAEKQVEIEYLRLVAGLRQSIFALDPASIAADGNAIWALSILRGD